MSDASLTELYRERISRFEAAVRSHSRILNYLSLARLLALVCLVWMIILGIRHHAWYFYASAGVMAILFLVLVVRYNNRMDLRELNRRLRALNEQEASCQAYDFHAFPDGSEFQDPGHAWSHDLDIFGKGSLYQYLNRSTTLRGHAALARLLTQEAGGSDQVRERQQLLQDLRDRIDFRQTYAARGSMLEEKEEDLDGIAAWLRAPAYISTQRWLFPLALLVSVISLGLIIGGLFQSGLYRYLLLVLIFNFSLLSPFLLRTNRYQEGISRKHDLLRGLAALLRIISGEAFTHPLLQEYKEQSAVGMKEVTRLSKLLSIFDQRLNMLLGAVFNGLFLFDFIMLHFLERWKRRNSESILRWVEISADMDAWVSLAGFAFNHPSYCRPELEAGHSPRLEGLGHPLIPASKRVCNDLELAGEKVVIITGANMAGKSTFLRALGVNLVLAYAGCPVCASAFRLNFLGLCSSMRTADSLADEESYFLAEIKKLQVIVQRMEKGIPLMILLDEVLKGTNTTDKFKGSVGLILRSMPYPVHCFIATHDLALGELEKQHPGQVVNFCFESYVNEAILTFDYTIRKGIATNMNASFLMKKMGIMD